MPTTLAQLRTQAQARADFENDTNVSNVAWASFVTGSRQRLRRLLVQANPQLFVLSKSFTLTAPTFTYDLLANAPTFWKSLALDYSLGSTDAFQQVSRFLWHERNHLTDRSFRIYGNTLEIRPANLSPGSYTLWYITQPATMSADGDALDLAEDIYSEFIVLEAAIKARRRQQKSADELTTELNAIVAEIRAGGADNDVGEPDRVLDTESSAMWPRYPRP